MILLHIDVLMCIIYLQQNEHWALFDSVHMHKSRGARKHQKAHQTLNILIASQVEHMYSLPIEIPISSGVSNYV